MTNAEILKFIDSCNILLLTTMDGCVPQTRAMNNIRNASVAPHLVKYFKKHNRILITTNTHSDKVGQIRVNSVANIYLFDTNYHGLLLIGEISKVSDKDTIDNIWDKGWSMFYPSGRDGGDFTVLEFVPKLYKSYNGNGFVKKSSTVEWW